MLTQHKLADKNVGGFEAFSKLYFLRNCVWYTSVYGDMDITTDTSRGQKEYSIP